MKSISPIELVEIAAEALGDLRERVVFVGGAITGLLLTDQAAPSTSSTKDVDIIISVTTRTEFLDRLAAKMRSLGFREDPEEDAPICRWLFPSAIKLDLMPTDPSILGFTNRWFADALRTAQPHKLPSGTRIRIVTAPYFLATKIEAFHSTHEFVEALCGHLPGEDTTRVTDRLARISGEFAPG